MARWVRCPACDGRGKTPCWRCNDEPLEEGEPSCAECLGEGTEPCAECDTEGGWYNE